MPGGPGVPNRNTHFSAGAADDPPFDLPPDKEAYYSAAEEGRRHREKMAGMSPKERHEYMRGLRETLNDDVPKKGDFDNPLKKDNPAPPRPAATPRQPNPVQVARARTRQFSSLAKKAKGRKIKW